MKKLLTAFAILCLVSFTPPADQSLTFKLSLPEAEVVLKALSKLPYEESAPVIQKLQMQAQPQLTDSSSKNKK